MTITISLVIVVIAINRQRAAIAISVAVIVVEATPTTNERLVFRSRLAARARELTRFSINSYLIKLHDAVTFLCVSVLQQLPFQRQRNAFPLLSHRTAACSGFIAILFASFAVDKFRHGEWLVRKWNSKNFLCREFQFQSNFMNQPWRRDPSGCKQVNLNLDLLRWKLTFFDTLPTPDRNDDHTDGVAKTKICNVMDTYTHTWTDWAAVKIVIIRLRGEFHSWDRVLRGVQCHLPFMADNRA